MRSFIVILGVLLLVFQAKAQNGKYPMGARQSAMGGASVVLKDQWGIYNNPGVLSLVEGSHVFATYQNRFNIAAFQVMGAGYVQSVGSFKAGAGFYRSGDDLFSEQRFNLAVSHQLDRVSLGVSVDYLQYDISTVGTKGVMVMEFGGLAEITDQIHFAAHIFNLNQAELVSEGNEKIPTVMKAGLSFRPTTDLILSVETEKDLDFDEVFKVGVEYQVVENVFLRTGLNTEPFNGAFGVGFYPSSFQFDYAFTNDTNLGAIHEVSVSYALSKP